MKIICAKCSSTLKCKKNGVIVEFFDGEVSTNKVKADVYSCPECVIEVVTNFAEFPWAENHEEGYAEVKSDYKVKK